MPQKKKRGKTVLCKGNYCVAAPCAPKGRDTAHENLAKALRWDPRDCHAGAIKSDGRIEYNSVSVNQTNFGHSKLRGKHKRHLEHAIRSGNYESRSS